MNSAWDNPEFHTVDAPDEWSWTAAGAIRCVPVSHQSRLLGYLWAALREEAAGFAPAGSATAHGRNAAIAWAKRLRQAKAANDSPLAALERWADEPEDPLFGMVPAGQWEELSSLAALDERARRS
ncbi:hypothetical protein [Nonomuraea recticatena]|uniref:Uncharacterized protein n=1 Tax=Nonomuraea recticatena TaxID=46178 RepID=A0ABP6EHN6_9ACTN